jgi:hypothetical protein
MSTTNPFEVTTPELPFASERQRLRLKRVGVLSMASFSGAIMAAMGLLASLFMALSFAFSAGVGGGAGGPEFFGGGVIAVVIPFIYGIMGNSVRHE